MKRVSKVAAQAKSEGKAKPRGNKENHKPKLLVVGLGFQAAVPHVLYTGGLDVVVTSLYPHVPYDSTIFVRATAGTKTISFDYKRNVHVNAIPLERQRSPDDRMFRVAEGSQDLVDALDFVSAVAHERLLPTLHLMEPETLILHCHDWLTAKAIPIIKQHSDVPAVFSVHMSVPRPPANYLDILKVAEEYGFSADLRSRVHAIDRRLFFEAQGCKEADVVHCVSNATAESVIKAYDLPKSKVKVIHNGVDTATYSPPTQKDHKEMEKVIHKYGITKPFILSTGRFVWEKNHKNLLEAFKIFHKSHPDYSLAIMGFDGYTYDELVKIREEMPDKMRHKVVIQNADMRQDVAMLYKACDISCSPSLEEAFGIVALEAMACAKPVVVGDVGGLKEVIKDEINGKAGLRVDAKSVDVLAAGLEKAADNKETWGKNARNYVVRNFSWEKIAKEYVKLYEKLV
ncbi:MAG: glycosyltransferase family 4 protein [Candidatus Hadarchaeota archaeon]